MHNVHYHNLHTHMVVHVLRKFINTDPFTVNAYTSGATSNTVQVTPLVTTLVTTSFRVAAGVALQWRIRTKQLRP